MSWHAGRSFAVGYPLCDVGPAHLQARQQSIRPDCTQSRGPVSLCLTLGAEHALAGEHGPHLGLLWLLTNMYQAPCQQLTRSIVWTHTTGGGRPLTPSLQLFTQDPLAGPYCLWNLAAPALSCILPTRPICYSGLCWRLIALTLPPGGDCLLAQKQYSCRLHGSSLRHQPTCMDPAAAGAQQGRFGCCCLHDLGSLQLPLSACSVPFKKRASQPLFYSTPEAAFSSC